MSSSSATPEIEAMTTLEAALAPLEEAERNRVLKWAVDRFGASTFIAPARIDEQGLETPSEFEELADLYDAASPSGEADQALVAAYWLQTSKSEPDFDSQRVNTELKHLGHGIGNITQAFTSLIKRKPRLVIQIKKAGKTQQARKKYKVTAEGRKAVRKMLAGETE